MWLFMSFGLIVFMVSSSTTATATASNLVFLPASTGALCLDGSPYGYYLSLASPSDPGRDKWVISIQGGGWCGDEGDCLGRSKGALGSSTGWSPNGGCYPGGGWDPGLVAGGNCAYLPYCDGASFSGYREDPWPVPPADIDQEAEKAEVAEAAEVDLLHFRGARNLNATLDSLFSTPTFVNATELLVVGTSAGGLSTLLHLDYIAGRVKSVAPRAKVKGVSDAGMSNEKRDGGVAN